MFHGTAVAPRYQVAHARGRSPRSPAALAGYQQRRMRHANHRRDGLRHGTPICTSRRGCGIAPESATQPVREGAPTAARAGRRGSPRPSRWLRGNSLTGRSQNCGRRNYSDLFARVVLRRGLRSPNCRERATPGHPIHGLPILQCPGTAGDFGQTASSHAAREGSRSGKAFCSSAFRPSAATTCYSPSIVSNIAAESTSGMEQALPETAGQRSADHIQWLAFLGEEAMTRIAPWRYKRQTAWLAVAGLSAALTLSLAPSASATDHTTASHRLGCVLIDRRLYLGSPGAASHRNFVTCTVNFDQVKPRSDGFIMVLKEAGHKSAYSIVAPHLPVRPTAYHPIRWRHHSGPAELRCIPSGRRLYLGSTGPARPRKKVNCSVHFYQLGPSADGVVVILKAAHHTSTYSVALEHLPHRPTGYAPIRWIA